VYGRHNYGIIISDN